MATTLQMGTRGGSGAGERPPPAPPPDEASLDNAPTVPITLGRPRCPDCGERFSRGSRFCAFDGTRLVDSPEETASDPLVGQVLGGKYTVLRPIGEGGMGTVYEVRHNALDRKLALKVLRPEIAQNAEHMQRFLQEAKAAAAIGHPSIVSVSDFGECEVRGRKVPYFVMELLRGTSLAALLKEEKTIPARRCATIIAACAEALDAAHASGVIHRDLKPDNIFVATGGDDVDSVKVLDFGVAKMQGAAKLTKIGMVFGTPHYMSPEQARGQTIDNRADIYALGVILYECLSGRVPFEADTSMGVLTKQIFANPEPIERVAPDPSALGALGPIVMRCLSKEPQERFASMGDLALAIRQVLRDPAGAAAEAMNARSSKRPSLRLREGAALPRSEPVPGEPAPTSWTRLVVFSAAGISVVALLLIVARAVLFPAQPAAPGTAASSSASAAVAPSSSASQQLASSTTAPAAPASAAVSAPASAEPVLAASAAPVASSPSAPATAHAPSAPATSPASTGTGAHKAAPSSTSPAVVDPWSRPTTGAAKKPPPVVVVDPWATKKK